ncbi:MAG: TAXI family TRAP transporter solute-binding subunit, partial [Gammaproteobacteria bacterium]|nr:TAXI family TRAP transporter solute-binding subunit [Gammaproteobacteria bacterium]
MVPMATAMDQQFITIGTGGVTGVYYPTGGAICRLVNKGKKKHGVRCSVESTGGSVYNINTIRAGELDMGVAQSDWQVHAYNGSGKDSFKKAGPFKELRAVFSVHPEPVSIVARKDSGIKHVSDLVGKRVNIGNPGSGTEATWNVMWKAMGKTNKDLKLAAQMKSAETPSALCDNKIDAFFWLVGNPAALNKEAATTCDVVFVEVSGPVIDKLVKENSFYRYAVIPGGMYRGNPNDIKTFGVGATFVSSTKTPAKTVYEVVKAVFENFDRFKKLHPAFAVLKKEEM